MANKTYTVLIVPERSSKVRRYAIPHRLVIRSVMGVLGALGFATFLLVHYFFMMDQAGENSSLKAENIALETRLRLVQEEIARIDGTLYHWDWELHGKGCQRGGTRTDRMDCAQWEVPRRYDRAPTSSRACAIVISPSFSRVRTMDAGIQSDEFRRVFTARYPGKKSGPGSGSYPASLAPMK